MAIESQYFTATSDMNPDAYNDAEDLRELAKQAAEFETAFHSLKEYCNMKAIAVIYRKEGDIKRAITFEECCEGIYKTLPTWARW